MIATLAEPLKEDYMKPYILNSLGGEKGKIIYLQVPSHTLSPTSQSLPHIALTHSHFCMCDPVPPGHL